LFRLQKYQLALEPERQAESQEVLRQRRAI
jgi:hypothetical protein